MERDVVFLYLIAGVSFLFAIFNGVLLAVKRGRTMRTDGTIVSIKSTNPANENWRNAKLAQVSYLANGKCVVSKKRIQVPLSSSVGTPVTVRYDKNRPEKVYSYSVKRMMIGFLISIGSVLVAIFL